jgi:hypothetical protein
MLVIRTGETFCGVKATSCACAIALPSQQQSDARRCMTPPAPCSCVHSLDHHSSRHPTLGGRPCICTSILRAWPSLSRETFPKKIFSTLLIIVPVIFSGLLNANYTSFPNSGVIRDKANSHSDQAGKCGYNKPPNLPDLIMYPPSSMSVPDLTRLPI